MKRSRQVGAVILLLAIVFLAGRSCDRHGEGASSTTSEGVGDQAELWTCSMHPQIRQPKPGLCPLCGMDLIPVETDSSMDAASRQLTLSPAARALAEVAVAPVERRHVPVEIRMVGKVQFDETRLAYISPRVSGRLDRLYANYAGLAVKAGDPLADLYSPDLVSAQQELLQAVKAAVGASSASLLAAARERLRLWGLTAEQIAGIEQSGAVREHVTFYAPIGGIVVEKEAREGQYVEPGMRLFTVADLSRVWVVLDAYESDLAWLREGQEVEFHAEAYPGESFKATIAFIEPVLDPMTRTVKVRLHAPNDDGRLKPEMFVRAIVRAGSSETADPPLVIPASAPLLTGERAVVYVAVPGMDGTYEGRDVVLGPRAGNFYLVREGLEEGEPVVVHGAFKLDSSLQIQGQPSMMAPEGGAAPSGHPPHGEAAPEAASAPRRQTLCPIMGGKIDKTQYADHQGLRVYFCCGGCEAEFAKDPEKYIAAMRAAGVEPEHVSGENHEH